MRCCASLCVVISCVPLEVYSRGDGVVMIVNAEVYIDGDLDEECNF